MAQVSKWKSIWTKILIGLAVIFVILQFIRPPSNKLGESPTAIQTQYEVPAEVQQLLQRSCYDCHSNNTDYPWYSYVQPMGWWLNGHIMDAKRELNFDEFASYPAFKQIRRLEAIRQEIEEEEMPLPEYTLIHRSAALSPEERERIIHWVQATQDTMKVRYPPDSLKRPPREGQVSPAEE